MGTGLGALGDVGVDSGSLDAAVAEQILHDAGVGDGFHEVGLPIRVTLLSPRMGPR